MMTRLPAGKGTPVPLGALSTPWPGAQAVSHGVFDTWANEVSGRGDSPKQVQPWLLPSSASAALARLGGTRNKMAWWTSELLPSLGWKSL